MYSLRSRSIVNKQEVVSKPQRRQASKRTRSDDSVVTGTTASSSKKRPHKDQVTGKPLPDDNVSKPSPPSPDLSQFSYVKSKPSTTSIPSSKASKPHTTAVASATVSWEPKQWREQLENIRTMRASRDAPVDTIGASKLAEETTDPKIKRYQTLISLMLSSQTKDEVTAAAMERLKEHGLSVTKINSTSQTDIEDLIKPVGFYRRKAGYIKNATQLLSDKYDNDIPQTLEGLKSLPGVGPKMAYLCMDIAWDSVAGIGVDTHVHRITNRLRWTRKPTSDPEETRKALEEWLPKEEWSEINWLLVGFGQQTCLPVGPKCSQCLNRKICPFASKNHKAK